MKRAIKRLFALFGIGIYRLNRSPIGLPDAKGTLHSPLTVNSKDQYEAFYSDCKSVTGYLDKKRLRFYNELLDIIGRIGIDCSGKHVADVGCGTGHLLLYINTKYHPASLTGFDHAKAAIETAKKNIPEADFCCQDVCDTTDVPKFDIVFCTEVLEHVLLAKKALKNLLDMTTNTLIITVPNGRRDTLFQHINFWSPESWPVFLGEACSGYNIKTGKMSNDTRIFTIISKNA